MAIPPGYKTNAEGEEEYIDKGAVTTPQYNTTVDAKYAAAKAEAKKADAKSDKAAPAKDAKAAK